MRKLGLSAFGLPMAVVLTIGAPFLAGCGSDEETPGSSVQTGGSSSSGQGGSGAEAGAGGAGAAPAGGSGGGTPMATVDVLVTDGSVDGAPVAGVVCALTAPGGQVQDGTTDDDGRITFQGIDWALGTASATCLFERRGNSLVDFDAAWVAERGQVRFVRPELADAVDTVQLSGELSSAVDPEHIFVVSADLGSWQGVGTSYTVGVPKGKPFDVIATEVVAVPFAAPHGFGQDFFAWAAVHSNGVDADTTLDIDLAGAEAATPVTLEGSVLLPSAAESIFRKPASVGMVFVTPADARYFALVTGGCSRSQYGAGATRLDYTAVFVDSVVPAPEVVTVHILYEGFAANDGRSYWLTPGYPTSGDVAEAFLDAPRLVAPPSSGSDLEGAVMQWDEQGEPATVLQVFGATYSWYVRSANAGATSIAIPALPSSVVGVDLFGGSVSVTLAAEGPLLPGLDFYEQLAVSHGVMLDP